MVVIGQQLIVIGQLYFYSNLLYIIDFLRLILYEFDT